MSEYTDVATEVQPCKSGSSCDRGGPLDCADTPPGICSDFESLPPALHIHCPVNIPKWNSQSCSSQHDQLPTLLGVSIKVQAAVLNPSPSITPILDH